MDTGSLDSIRRPGDRLRQLRAFCHAARLESFTHAAAYIFSSQSSVSEQVRLLEEELDVTLFDRNGPRLILTPSGHRLYEHVLPLVARMDRLPDTFTDLHRGLDSGELQLAAGQSTASFVLPGYLKRFQVRYPGIRMRVQIGTGGDQLRWLRAYEVDVVLEAMGVVARDLEFRPLFSAGHVLITPEDHPLAGRASVTLPDVASFPKVGHPTGTHVRMMADLFARRQRLVNPIDVEIGGWLAIKEYVEAGLGIGVVPDFCLTEDDRLWRIPMDDLIPPRPYGLVLRRDGILSLPAREFIRLVDPDFPEEARETAGDEA